MLRSAHKLYLSRSESYEGRPIGSFSCRPSSVISRVRTCSSISPSCPFHLSYKILPNTLKPIISSTVQPPGVCVDPNGTYLMNVQAIRPNPCFMILVTMFWKAPCISPVYLVSLHSKSLQSHSYAYALDLSETVPETNSSLNTWQALGSGRPIHAERLEQRASSSKSYD